MKTRFFKSAALSAALVGYGVFGGDASGADKEVLVTPDGRPVFEYNYVTDAENQTWNVGDLKPGYSGIRDALRYGGNYWTEILAPVLKNSRPAKIRVFGDNDQNASAMSDPATDPRYHGYTQLGASLLKNMNGGGEYVAAIKVGAYWPYYGTLGDTDYDNPAYHYTGSITHQPQNGDQMHLASTMFHEIGHALGVGSTVYPNTKFSDTLLLWDSHLYDDNGNAARPGQTVSLTNAPDTFYVAAGSQPTFRGQHVMDVVRDAMPNGLPINGWEPDGNGGLTAEFSHIELRNSMMSHTQVYQNYTTYMEAELAVIQDLGYAIDRKLYYGRSIYGDNGTINNTTGFKSSATAGVGLHVYGTGNTIRQDADIASSGYGSLGIRVDGWENSLTIAPGVSVRADGEEGRAVAIAYGRNQSVNHRGVITADGKNGRGLSFDFGSNATGDYYDYRGSWVYQEVQAPDANADRDYYSPGNYPDRTQDPKRGTVLWTFKGSSVHPEVAGSLADKVDISGGIRVGDKGEAIYISENAHVKEINILNGAAIQGDITSKWRLDAVTLNVNQGTTESADYYLEKGFQYGNPDGSFGENGEYSGREELHTTLTFGKAADANGVSQTRADADFSMRYDGNINGGYSMKMHVVGGELEYNGNANIFGIVNDGTISGNGTFTVGVMPVASLAKGTFAVTEGFKNNGVIAPGGDGIGNISIVLGDKEVQRDITFVNSDDATVTSNFVYKTANAIAPDFTSAGTLAISFNAAGEHDTLTIRGTDGASNKADIGGVKSFRPTADFYANGWSATLNNADIIKTDDVTLVDASTAGVSTDSQTLQFGVTDNNNGSYTLTASRAADAYRRIAASRMGFAAASELDRIAALGGTPTEDMQRVLTAMDWISDPSAASRAVGNLEPTRQGVSAQGLFQTQRAFNQSFLTRFTTRGMLPGVRLNSVDVDAAYACVPPEYYLTAEEGTFFFATPLGGGGRQSARGADVPGYSYWQTGGALGVEKRSGGNVLGLHLAMNHLRMKGRDSGDTFRNTGLALGVHGRLSPAEWGGFHLFGMGRAGVDLARDEREVVVGLDRGVNKSKWTGMSASALLGGGYDFEVVGATFGPVASIEYAMNYRPSRTEDSGGLGRLEYKGTSYNSLRTNLGAHIDWDVGCRASVSLTAAWSHELLDKTGTTKAGFAGYGNNAMSIRAKTGGRDSLTASAAIRFMLNDKTSLSVEGGGEFLRKGAASGWGGMSLTRAF